ncbi:uncharacterized protein LOC108625677 [Ceratina calcarata]|uniref:Uncharacterized protein LOC108625677 n=1 Tax=Ceratina calcarata TaxID=156304 RepID=A0AAJ7J0R0_9HYME|nr:uncharacterized protein LOC108625677 [Ceratina calcarata]
MEGASFESILRYVLKNMKITQARASFLVMEVLKAGVALGRIKRTPRGTYLLATDKTAHNILHHVREPRFTDDSDDDVSSEESL